MEGVDSVFGIYFWIDVEFGIILVEEGLRMVFVDFFKIIVKGRGGYGLFFY